MRTLHLSHFLVVAGVACGVAMLPSACSPDSGLDPSTTTSSSGVGGTDQDGGLFDVIESDVLDPDAACAVVTEQAISLPLNLYIMMDKSSSMVGTKWDASKAGLTAFVNDPKFTGVRVALRFFPRPADGVPMCDQFAYKEPTVPYGPLPANATAIIQAIEAESPDGFSTPIYPALGGALLKGIELAQNNPGEVSAVLLVTDGEPQGPAPLCGSVNPEDPAVIAALAANGATFNPPVLTYVIGLPGVNQSFANLVAASGGTESAILVGATNVAVEFKNALAKATGASLPCEYEIPSKVEGGEIAYTAVNVVLSMDGAPAQTIPQNIDCNGQGWYYDNPANPTKIVLCPDSCTSVKDASTAQIDILLGCQTVVE